MASDPKKSIEQMLEALAKARRAQFGDDPKMPNPMRARLHEEIGRTEAAEDQERDSRPSWLTMFWPRLTVAAALATLIVLVPAIWWNQSHPVAESVRLTLRDRAAAPVNELNPAIPAQDALARAPAFSATEPAVNLAENNQIKMEPAAAPSSESEAVKPSTHLAQGRGETELPGEVTSDIKDKEVAAAKIEAAPAAASESKTKADRIAAAAPPVAQQSSSGSLATTRQFSQQSQVQSFRNKAQVTRPANVLNTFRVQQEGNEIQVLDADGSTYKGKIEQSPKNADVDARIAARRDLARQAPGYAAKAIGKSQPAIPQSHFRATGYNVSLKKTLVFEGNYAEPPPQQPATPTSNDREQAGQSRVPARIVGTVRVNGEAPVKVDAVAETTDAQKSGK
jgi:hypothetical protein